MRLRSILLSMLLLVSCVGSGAAQTYPSRLVRFIVPFPAGGGIDVLIRAVAQELQVVWGQSVIVENRAGAGGVIGSDFVAKAQPDGLTLLATVNQSLTSGRFLYKSLPYDPDAFAPVMLMVQSDHFLLANPAVKANNLPELIDLVRREPGKWNYGSFGSGTQPHLVYEILNKVAKLDVVHVPYTGIAPLLLGIVANDVQLTTGSAGVAGELIRGGKVKALAIAGEKRSSQFPDIPTTAEVGFPALQATIWYGVFAPSGTDADIVKKINADVRNILNRPDFAKAHVSSKGLDLIASSPNELAATIKSETQSVGEIIRTIGIEAR